ncbi:MAG: ABC transporter ATP-binding protein [Candidatus Binataceae bacterium]|nr:ABC transporter ATP-binding protein [Candidatus Binataceae bacterium]
MRSQAVATEDTDLRAPISAAAPAIEVEHLSFSYRDRRALDDLSFTIRGGALFGFLGPNGGGKTTLFRVLSTLAPPQNGRARLFGYDLAGSTLEVRRRLGVVFQHPSIDEKLTVAENLAHHGHLYGLTGAKLRERIAVVLDQLGLEERRGELAQTLSGGLKRRVELAKALLHEPQMLLLDEPGTGLDPAARRDFHNVLTQLREIRQVTIVMTTHYMEEAERCDTIGILHQGRIVASGPPAELKARVGGDVIVIHTPVPDVLIRELAQRLQLEATVVDGTVRIERPCGHELIREVVEMFRDRIDSVTFGKPTLEDVFIHLTGHRFVTESPASAQ